MNIRLPGVVFNDATLDKARKEFQRILSPDAEHKSWFSVKNKDTESEVFIYGEIGYYGVTAQDLIQSLSELDNVKNLTLRINSPGGEVFEALAILNYLRDLKAKITVKIDGVAASAASFLAMAGDEVIAMPNSKMMIHMARGMAYGQATDLRTMADLLDDTSNMIADIYADRAGGERADWIKAMEGERWYTAEEALEAGLVAHLGGVQKSGASKCENRRIGGERVAQLGNILRIAALHSPPPMIVPEIEPVTDDEDFDFDFSSVIQDAKRDLDDIPWDPEERS